MTKKRICVVTGTRADYGLLYWVMKEIAAQPEFELQIAATGMHLSPEFGLTYKVIEMDGFVINEKVEMLLSGDTPTAIAKSMGLATIGFADAFQRLNPDMLVLLGDRFEILAVAQVALVLKIPIAHIAGGDVTEGAFDEAIRHCVTKLSHLHLVTNDVAARRVRQMGENPDHVFNVGSPGIDQILRLPLLTRAELEEQLDFTFREKNLLITFHPATLDQRSSADQFRELLGALDKLGPDVGLIFSKPNADTGGRELMGMVDEYVAARFNTRAFTSLGQLRYLSTLALVDAVVGNSSSGLYEAPSLKTPTVNIGDRQQGRLQASSVVSCEPITDAIHEAIHKAFELDCSSTVNPYGDGKSAARIVAKLKEFASLKHLTKKRFYEEWADNESN